MNPSNLQRETSLAQLLKNSLFNSAGRFGVIVTTFIVTPIFVIYFGEEVYGIFALLTGLVGYYNLLDLGLSRAITKFVSKYYVVENDEAVSKLINAALIVQTFLGLIGLFTLLIFDKEIVRLFNVSSQYFQETAISIKIISVGFFFNMLSGTFLSTLQGIQRYDITSKAALSIEIIKNVGIAIILLTGFGLKEAVFVASFTSVLSLFLYVYLLKRNFRGWTIKTGTNFIKIKELFGFSSFIFISNLSRSVGDYGVRFFISYFLGPRYVTYFVVSGKVLNAVNGILTNAFNILFPYASELQSVGELKALKAIWINGTKLLCTISFPLFLAISISSHSILSLWINLEFANESWWVLSLLAIVFAIKSITIVPINIGLGLGKAKLLSLFSLISLVIYFSLLPLTLPNFGLLGLLFVLLLSSIPGIIFTRILSVKYIDVKFIRFLRDTISVHVISVIICSTILLMFYKKYLNLDNTYYNFLLSAIFLITNYGILYIIDWIPNPKKILRSIH